MPQLPADMMSSEAAIPEISTGGGGSSFASDAFKTGSGVAPTIASLVYQRKRRKLAHEARVNERVNRLKQYNFGLEDLAVAEGDVRRQGEREPGAVRAAMANAGAVGGSQEKQALEDQKYNLASRFNAIQRARARLKHGYDAGERLASLQRRNARLEQNEAKLSAILDTAMKVAGAIV